MTAKMISDMIRKVTGRKISPRTILSTAAGMLCKGAPNDHGTKYFNSDEIEKILLYHEFNPAAFIGKG